MNNTLKNIIIIGGLTGIISGCSISNKQLKEPTNFHENLSDYTACIDRYNKAKKFLNEGNPINTYMIRHKDKIFDADYYCTIKMKPSNESVAVMSPFITYKAD